MKASRLKKGQSFTINGWDDDIVLEVLVPKENKIMSCIVKDDDTWMSGIGILAGRGNITGTIADEMYFIPVLTSVTVVK